jgi:hypothetical protein
MSQITDAYVCPDFDRAALITIDMQCDFLSDGAAAILGTTEVLPSMRLLVDWFRASVHPIVHVVRLYQADGSNVDLCRRGMIEGGQFRIVAVRDAISGIYDQGLGELQRIGVAVTTTAELELLLGQSPRRRL